MRSLRRILVPSDSSPVSTAALDVAVFLAGPAGADVEVLHVWDVRSRGWIESALDEPLAIDAPAHVRVRQRAMFGSICDTIVRVANTERFDLLVIGLNEMPSVTRTFGPDLVQRVAAASHCPVIAVADGATGFAA